jgi:hypothetical protein
VLCYWFHAFISFLVSEPFIYNGKGTAQCNSLTSESSSRSYSIHPSNYACRVL